MPSKKTCYCHHPRQSHEYDGACRECRCLCRCLIYEAGPSSGVPSVYTKSRRQTTERERAPSPLPVPKVQDAPTGSMPSGDAE